MENFKPENTAIAARNSKSAEMLKKVSKASDKILDYGCGTGRNMEFIYRENGVIAHGTDIPEQLKKENKRHSKLRSLGMTIEASELIEKDFYTYALNSHVLNVIADDNIKRFVLKDIYSKLKKGGKAFIEVRTKRDVESAKTKEKYGDGWKIKCKGGYTYQEGISKEKMVDLVTSAGFLIDEHIFNNSKHIVVASK